MSAAARPQDLLPKPHISQFSDNSYFSLDRNVVLSVPEIGDADPAIYEELTNLVIGSSGTVVPTADASIVVSIVDNVPLAEFQDEAYKITIETDVVDIKATTLKGAYWAVQTLWQLAENNGNNINCGEITDWAAFRIRGYTHDVGRGYLEFDELLKEIEKLSRYKINTFHWHLTENQGWRLESKVYPQLNNNSSYTRLPGKYYTIDQAKQLVAFAARHGVTVIPEIDMPGHSQAFRNAMGHSMLTTQGLAEMKEIMTEACETFSGTPWMHIGTDELRTEDYGTMNWTSFVPQMVSHIRSKGKKVVSWNPGYSYASSGIDMIHMWSSSGRLIEGVPAIDSRYHYANHFDNYADIVSLYKCNIAEQEKGSDQYAGVIISFWNDRYLPSDDAIIRQNSVYSSMLAIAERSWLGGGDGYFPVVGTLLHRDDADFFDWENRFLYHKENYLKDVSIPYVRQSNIHWRITDAFPNNGNLTASFPPETSGISDSYEYNGTTYGTSDALGAGVYLRHVWGTAVPGFYSNPQTNHTAYAYTYVYSPVEQQVGLMVEFQNYSRSESDLPPLQGKWDYKESKIWVNDHEIAPPVWENTHTAKSSEVTLKNENMTARPPIAVTLNQGWNKVMLKLPVGSFTQTEIRLVKWMFNCVFTTLDGKNSVDGLIYSPDQNMNPSLDVLLEALSKANKIKNGVEIGSNPGQYPEDAVAALDAAIADAQKIKNGSELSNEEYEAAAEELNAAVAMFSDCWNRPKISTDTKSYWYKIYAPERENKVVAFRYNNSAIYGETYNPGKTSQQWKFVELSDGTVAIVNRSSDSYISPNSTNNTALKAQSGMPTSGGWTLRFINSGSYFIVVCGENQLNQTSSTHNYQIFNWGSGSNSTDGGCLFKFEQVDYESNSALSSAISNARSVRNGLAIGDAPGQYPQDAVDRFDQILSEMELLADNSEATEDEIEEAIVGLNDATQNLLKSYNTPILSTPGKDYWYSISCIRDGVKAMTWTASYTYGHAYNGAHTQHWKFVGLSDNTFALINRSQEHCLLTNATIASGGNSPVLVFGSQSGMPISNGWKWHFLNDGVQFALFSDQPSQIHMLNSGSDYKLGDYGIDAVTGAINTTDIGCKFTINFREYVYDENLAGIEDIPVDNEDRYRIYVEGRDILVHAPDDSVIRIYDSMGRVMGTEISSRGVVRFNIGVRGLFFIQVDGRTFKIVL